MKRPSTFSSIASELGKDKRTVQLWYQKHKAETGIELGAKEGENGTRYFTDEDREILVGYGSSPISPRASVVVETGNHAESKIMRVGASKVNLEQFRTTRVRGQLSNRLDFLEQSADFLDQIEQGMDEAEADVENELQEIRVAKRQTKRRIEDFRRRSDQYRIKTDILASIQNSELDELDELSDEMNSLGKPAESTDRS